MHFSKSWIMCKKKKKKNDWVFAKVTWLQEHPPPPPPKRKKEKERNTGSRQIPFLCGYGSFFNNKCLFQSEISFLIFRNFILYWHFCNFFAAFCFPHETVSSLDLLRLHETIYCKYFSFYLFGICFILTDWNCNGYKNI